MKPRLLCLALGAASLLSAQSALNPSGTATSQEAVQLSVFTVNDDKNVGYESTTPRPDYGPCRSSKNVAGLDLDHELPR
jgi:hypothetical protein